MLIRTCNSVTRKAKELMCNSVYIQHPFGVYSYFGGLPSNQGCAYIRGH